MSQHLRPEQIEEYLLGMMDPGTAVPWERHASECAACTARIAAEARLELKLRSLVARAGSAPRARRWKRVLPIAAAGIAAAAAVLVLVAVVPLRPPGPARPAPLPASRVVPPSPPQAGSSMCLPADGTLASAARPEEARVCSEPAALVCSTE